jgi:hypothetical protein
MSDNKPQCCYLFQDDREKTCANKCRWAIRDTDNRDPHTSDTYACDVHLAELLQDNNEVHFIGDDNDHPCPI